MFTLPRTTINDGDSGFLVPAPYQWLWTFLFLSTSETMELPLSLVVYSLYRWGVVGVSPLTLFTGLEWEGEKDNNEGSSIGLVFVTTYPRTTTSGMFSLLNHLSSYFFPPFVWTSLFLFHRLWRHMDLSIPYTYRWKSSTTVSQKFYRCLEGEVNITCSLKHLRIEEEVLSCYSLKHCKQMIYPHFTVEWHRN